MNAVSYILRFLAIAGALTAGALWYLTGDKLTKEKDAIQAQLNSAKAELSTAQSELTAANEATEAANAKAAQATADATAANNRLSELATQVRLANDEAEAAKASVQSLNNQIASLQNQITAQNGQIAALTTQVSSSSAGLSGPRPPVTSGGSGGGPTPGSEVTPVVDADSGAPVVAANPLPTKILEVSAKNGLVVLSGGSSTGMQNNAQLVLQSEGNPVGKVLITDSRENFAVAVVLVGTDMKKLKVNQELEYIPLR